MRRNGRRSALVIKRLLDAGVAGMLLLVLAPLLVALGVAVRLTSPGAAIFRQVRVGMGGRSFVIYKFRTMTQDAPSSPLGTYAYRDDPRITRLGRLLRRTSVDELPQLVNVLKGEMSIVGPRPDLPHHVDAYSAHQRRRLEMRPGITGLAQVSGRNDLSWEERIELDVEYVERWSLRLDGEIVVRTAAVILTGKGSTLPRSLGDQP